MSTSLQGSAALCSVVFDIDDTLYLERDYVRSGFQALAAWGEKLEIPDFPARAWRLFEQGQRGSIFNQVLRAAGIDATDAVVGELVSLYRRHRPHIELLCDARQALDDLHGQLCLAAVTDGPVESQRSKVEALGLCRWLDPIILTGELGEGFGKPHPKAFEAVMAQHGTSGAACAYVADNPAKDFAAPAALGWHTIRIRRREGLHFAVPSGTDVQLELDTLTGLGRALGIRQRGTGMV